MNWMDSTFLSKLASSFLATMATMFVPQSSIKRHIKSAKVSTENGLVCMYVSAHNEKELPMIYMMLSLMKFTMCYCQNLFFPQLQFDFFYFFRKSE